MDALLPCPDQPDTPGQPESGITDLEVVDEIEWERLADDTLRTSGGRFRLWANWQPADLDLRADRFRYRLPPVEATGLPSLSSQQTIGP
jgi:hypothetical protein